MKTLNEWLQEEGPVTTFLEELTQKYSINENMRKVTHFDVIQMLKGDGNVNIDPFTNKTIIQAGFFGLEIHGDGSATLLTLDMGD